STLIIACSRMIDALGNIFIAEPLDVRILVDCHFQQDLGDGRLPFGPGDGLLICGVRNEETRDNAISAGSAYTCRKIWLDRRLEFRIGPGQIVCERALLEHPRQVAAEGSPKSLRQYVQCHPNNLAMRDNSAAAVRSLMRSEEEGAAKPARVLCRLGQMPFGFVPAAPL